jgi:uncharacterized membrane protein (DUF106 family)
LDEKEMDLWSDLLNSIVAVFEPVSLMPFSAPFVILISVGISLLSLALTKKFSDVEKLKANMEEIKEWQQKFKVARESMNPVLLQEVMDHQQRIMRLNAEVMSARMKPMCLFYIPLLIIWGIFQAVYNDTIVAVIPFNIHEAIPFFEGWLGWNVPDSGFGLSFFTLYIMASFSLGTLIRKLAGIDVT